MNPFSVFSDGTKLYVADSSNHRVVIILLSSINSTNITLGQISHNSNSPNRVDGISLTNQRSSFKDSNGKYYVADSANHRVLIWNTVPTDANTPANVVLGQVDM